MTDFNRISFDIEGTGPRKCYNDKIKYMFFVALKSSVYKHNS